MRKPLLVITIILFMIGQSFAQIGINTDNSAPHSSALLDLNSTEKGFLLPRMTTTERDNIPAPAAYLMIINTTTHSLEAYNARTSSWETIHSFVCPDPGSPSTGIHIPDVSQIIWNWNSVPFAAGYKWNTIDEYSTAIEIGANTTTTETGLTCNTAYTRYVWAYNHCGVSTSSALMQTTSGSPTPAAGTHVSLQTQIEWNWNSVPGATGYKWNTVNDYATASDMLTGLKKNETGLACNTSYTRYVWSYNACGNSTATVLTQTTAACSGWDCGQPITDSRDSKTYTTVQIGTQCWMAQNLNIGTRVNGAQNQYNNGIIEKYCHNDLESSCDAYGGLYQWHEMMQYSYTPGILGICPAGWHLPTDEEYAALMNLLGGTGLAGGAVKEAGTSHWFSPNAGATNASGFTALPGSYRNYLGGFGAGDWEPGKFTSYWTSTFNYPPNFDCSFTYTLWYTNDDLLREEASMPVNGFSVRCVKN